MRRFLQWLYANFLSATGALWWAKRQLRRDGSIVALTFHRVLDDASYQGTNSQPEIIIREKTFRDLIAYIVHRYEPVGLAESTPGTPSRKPKLALTFDDGWEDNYRVAFPITRQSGLPLLIFLTPGLLHRNAPFWPEQVIALMRRLQPACQHAEVTAVIESLKRCGAEEREQRLARLRETAHKQGISITPSDVDGTMSWHQILQMDRAGIKFGSHTQSHLILTTAQLDTVRGEVTESKALIESVLGKRCDTFSYPNGNWSPETRRLLVEAGYRLAVTTDAGVWNATGDTLAIPRCNIYEDKVVGPTGRFSPPMFEYTTLWKAWYTSKAKSGLSPRRQQIESARTPIG